MKYALILPLALGCSLTKPTKPLPLRHFAPDIPEQARAEGTAPCGTLAFGRMSARTHLRYRIVHRRSPVEVAMYETLRWTDRPDVYVQRALSEQLFEREGLVQTASSSDLVLEIDVLAFEQVDAPVPGGHVKLAYRLRDNRTVVDSGTINVERPSRTPRIENVIQAIGAANEAATAELAERIAPIVRQRSSCNPVAVKEPTGS